MDADLQTRKADLRAQTRVRVRAMEVQARIAGSHAICTRLKALPLWSAAKTVLMFSCMPDEPDLMRLVDEALASKDVIALPRYSATNDSYVAARVQNLLGDLTLGKFNVLEPRATCPEVPLNRLDLALVPGVAFDLHGRRLGRGKGFYDRLLAAVRGTKCGVAFDEQIVGEVPAGPLDIRLNCILTPTRWIET